MGNLSTFYSFFALLKCTCNGKLRNINVRKRDNENSKEIIKAMMMKSWIYIYDNKIWIIKKDTLNIELWIFQSSISTIYIFFFESLEIYLHIKYYISILNVQIMSNICNLQEPKDFKWRKLAESETWIK